MRLASLSKPTEAIPTNARPADLAQVHARGARRRAIVAQPRRGSSGMPSTRAKSLPRPPGRTPSTAPGTSRSASAIAPTMPSPLSATTVSPGRAASQRELARVVEVARVDAAHGQPVRAQRALELGREAPGLAAAGGRVDDQADGRGHHAKRIEAG